MTEPFGCSDRLLDVDRLGEIVALIYSPLIEKVQAMAPRTFGTDKGLFTSQRSGRWVPLNRLGLGASVVLGIGLQASGAIAAPVWLSQTAAPANDTGDVIIDSGSTNPSPTSPSSTSPSSTYPRPSSATLGSTRFSCQMTNGQYTVMYQPESQPGQAYPWAVPSNMGGGWDAARRCNEITRRLEAYRPDGLLEMRTGVENGYNTICVTTQRVPGCRIVLTVPPGQDPVATRDRVFQNLTIADNGQQTQGVNTFTSSNRGGIVGEVARWLGISAGTNPSSGAYSNGINLRPFLDPADGGTGQFLRGRAATPGRRLNPNKFR